MIFTRLNNFAPTILRFSMGLVFLWFGYQQFTNTAAWISFLPQWIDVLPMSSADIVFANGLLEIVLGFFLIFGLFIRLSALILAIHLLLITISIGFNATGVRDFGLTVATLAIAFYGPDDYSLDKKILKKELESSNLQIN